MKKKILIFLNLKTEKEYQQMQDTLFKKIDNITQQKDSRFNKLLKDLKKDGVDVDRHLTVFEKPFNLSGWDTSKINIGKMFSDMRKTPFEIEQDKNEEE